MAEWTDPDELTAVTGEALPTAWWNAFRDNFHWLYTPPQLAVRVTADQAVANAADHTVSWGEAVWDSTAGDMWDSTSPTKITIPRAGVYSIVCSMLWEEGTDGTKRSAFLEVGGIRRRGLQLPAVDPTEFQLCAETNLALGDELEIVVRQLSGAALDLIQQRTVMTVRWVGAPPVLA